MLKLNNNENDISLECDIVGYQFPDNPADNWLLLRVQVRQENKFFEKVDASLETNDLMALLEWFECLSQNRLPRYAHLVFTEPCICFEYLASLNSKVRISIGLSHELTPDFKLEPFESEVGEWDIVFDLNSKDFETVINDIKSELKLYPNRTRSADR